MAVTTDEGMERRFGELLGELDPITRAVEDKIPGDIVLVDAAYVDECQHAEAADLLARLVAMLTKLCRSIVAVAVAVNDHVNGRPPFVMRPTSRRSASERPAQPR